MCNVASHSVCCHNEMKVSDCAGSRLSTVLILYIALSHYFLQLWFLSFFFIFLSFFLVYSHWLEVEYLPYFHTWCGLSANLGCRSEMCCTRLAENTGRKNSPSALCCTTLTGYIFTTTIWWTSTHSRLRLVSEFGASQQISTGFASWLCYCTIVAQRRSTKLYLMFGRLLGWYTMYTFLGVLVL